MSEETRYETYKGYHIAADARLDPIVGEGLQLNPVYEPIAFISWDSDQGLQEARVEAPEKRVFAEPADARKLALGLAKRYIDELVGKQARQA